MAPRRSPSRHEVAGPSRLWTDRLGPAHYKPCCPNLNDCARNFRIAAGSEPTRHFRQAPSRAGGYRPKWRVSSHHAQKAIFGSGAAPALTAWENSTCCRSPFEKSQFLPDRNVTARPVDMTLRFRGTRPPRNGITAKRRVRARGSRAGAGLPGGAAQPLRPSFSPSIIRRPCEPAEPLRVVSRGRSCAAARSRPACQDQHRRWPEAPRLSRCLEVRRARLRARRHRRPEVRPVQ